MKARRRRAGRAVGGDAWKRCRSARSGYRKQYKIQEVIKRRQVLLVQVVKEERGNRRALTTDLSLRALLRADAHSGARRRHFGARYRFNRSAEAEIHRPGTRSAGRHGRHPPHAGASRSKAEVKRDFEYCCACGDGAGNHFAIDRADLVYEEGSLIKRAIRDLYNKDIDEVVVAGENGDPRRRNSSALDAATPRTSNPIAIRPLFAKSGVETQLDAMFSSQGHLEVGRLYRHQSEPRPWSRSTSTPAAPRASIYRGHGASHQSRGLR